MDKDNDKNEAPAETPSNGESTAANGESAAANRESAAAAHEELFRALTIVFAQATVADLIQAAVDSVQATFAAGRAAPDSEGSEDTRPEVRTVPEVPLVIPDSESSEDTRTEVRTVPGVPPVLPDSEGLDDTQMQEVRLVIPDSEGSEDTQMQEVRLVIPDSEGSEDTAASAHLPDVPLVTSDSEVTLTEVQVGSTPTTVESEVGSTGTLPDSLHEAEPRAGTSARMELPPEMRPIPDSEDESAIASTNVRREPGLGRSRVQPDSEDEVRKPSVSSNDEDWRPRPAELRTKQRMDGRAEHTDAESVRKNRTEALRAVGGSAQNPVVIPDSDSGGSNDESTSPSF